jgi:addiction module HigA family antidote
MLHGDRDGQSGIRINDQWRLCFTWQGNDACDVEIVDYTRRCASKQMKIPPVHPGEVLWEDYLKPMGISQYQLAKGMKVYPRKINEIVHGKRSITADTALRLSRYLGTTAELWLNLQTLYDLETTRDAIEEQVVREITPLVRDTLNTAAA